MAVISLPSFVGLLRPVLFFPEYRQYDPVTGVALQDTGLKRDGLST